MRGHGRKGVVIVRVKNKKVIRETAKITYRANRKRNALTCFAMFLTTFMITVVISLGISYYNTITMRQLRMEGMDYDIELTEPRADQVEKIRSMKNVRYAGVAVKCAILGEYQGKIPESARLYQLDQTCWEKQVIPALEWYRGTYPQKENEIMLSSHLLKAMGIRKPKIGMTLPVTYYSLADAETDEAVPDDPAIKKDFVLSGWYHDYTGKNRGYVSHAFYQTTGVKQTDFTRGALKISLTSSLYSKKDMLQIQNEIALGTNQLVIGNDQVISQFFKMLAVLAGMLLMIFTSGALFIYNTMYISISRDIRYYGQLKTIGMTCVQLKKMIYLQLLWNSAVGIPAGLLTAALIMRKGIPTILQLINPELGSYDIIPARIWIYILAGGFALLISLLSSKKPAGIAGNCSPVEAMRYMPKSVCRKKRKSGDISLFSMSFQNMFRDPKQAVMIFLSFIIGISVFLVANVYIHENDAKFILNETLSWDMKFLNQTTLGKERQIFTEDKIRELEEIPGVKSVRKVSSTYAKIPYQEEVFGEYYQELYQTRYAPGNYKEDMKKYQEHPEESSLYQSGFLSVDEEGFAYLNKRLGNVLNREDFLNGKTAVATKILTKGDDGMTGKKVHFSLPDGLHPDQEYTIEIAAVDENGLNSPAFFSRGWTPDLIVSETYAKKLLGELYIERLDVEYDNAYAKDTERDVRTVFAQEKKVSSESKLENYAEMRESETQAKVLGYSIGVIIALLAVLNYLNMLAASVLNRFREFAILESIGMTTKQIKRGLNIEGIGYGLISIAGSLPAGLPASYAVFKLTNMYYTPYSIPWKNNLLLFMAVLLLCAAAPVCIYRTMYRTSIIAQLRAGEE